MKRILTILTFGILFPLLAQAHGGVNDEELIIRMNGNGFEPKELTLVQGDEVLFINNDDVDRWPASNFHPTHEIYPEFDTKRGVAPGQSWKMRFEKVGTWRMHDHLIPHFTGTIVVLENPTGQEQGQTLNTDSQGLALDNPKQSFWDKIKSFFSKLFTKDKPVSTEGNTQYEKLVNISERDGPRAAWQYLLDTYKTPEGVIGNPHDMAHLVGQLLFKTYRFDGLSTCTPDFAFGCYHGLMEIAFGGSSASKYKEQIKEAENGCADTAPTTSPSHWSCIHGIGHGVATYRDYDLPPAIEDCRLVSKSVQPYCFDGVFMEFSINAPENFYRKDEPLYPCTIVPEENKIGCARAQTQVMRMRLGLETREISRICQASDNANITYHCIDALGYFTAQIANRDPEKIIKGCQEIEDKKNSAQCLAAAAGELVFQNVVGWQQAVQTICKSLGETEKVMCEERVRSVAKSYGR